MIYPFVFKPTHLRNTHFVSYVHYKLNIFSEKRDECHVHKYILNSNSIPLYIISAIAIFSLFLHSIYLKIIHSKISLNDLTIACWTYPSHTRTDKFALHHLHKYNSLFFSLTHSTPVLSFDQQICLLKTL